MAKKNEVVEVRPTANAIALPDYMQSVAEAERGLDTLKQYVRPPSFKVIQKSSGSDLLAQFGEGDLIVTPDTVLYRQMLHEGPTKADWKGEPFRFTPVFFFAEWCCWNPIQMKGTLPAVRERTMDPKHEIAVKARDKNLRLAPCPENNNFKIHYVEHLNFIVALHDGPYAGTGVAMSFSRASHRHGVRLCNLIQMRKAPIYGCVFQGKVIWEQNNMGDWWAVVAENPELESGSPWVLQELFEGFKAQHLEFKGLHDRLIVDYDSGSDPEAADVNTKEY